jgi:predicted PurR-regulated permease PerM
VFFGLLTFLTSFMPTVGTSIVSLPLAGLLWLTGKTWGALFLVAWSLGVVGLIDNLLRPLLIRGDVHIHGAVIFFSLLGGIALFGLVGLVVGPMALSLFLAMLRFHARDVRHEVATATK